MHQVPFSRSRRTFLVASGAGFAGFQFGRPRLAQATGGGGGGRSTLGKAKSTILFFLNGGASHIDMWDMKPQAPREYRGPFEPIATSAPGIELCEHLPLLSRQAHHLALIRSVDGTVNTNDHHAGYYYNLTGHVPDLSFRTEGNNRKPYPDDWPFMGSVVGMKRERHAYLPNAITLPYKPSRPPYIRPGQFAARLGVEHDPMYLLGSQDDPLTFRAPALELQSGVSFERLQRRKSLLESMDAAHEHFLGGIASQTWSSQQERAWSLLASSKTTEAFDLEAEPQQVRERYGESLNGMSLLLARRLVEAGVPFVTVFWMGDPDFAKKHKCASGGGWDTHGNNFECLKGDLLPQFDRGFSALIEDLEDRGMLDETLLLVTSEMGRKPKIGDPRSGGASGAGRDHWTFCLTDVMAGGGIRGGQVYGSTDPLGEYPAERPVTPADVTKTVYDAMGIDDLEATDLEGRPYNLLEEGAPLTDLF